MSYIFLFALCLFHLFSSAQKIIDVSKGDGLPQNVFYSVGGEPFLNVKFVRLVSGTPYFKDEWLKGSGVSVTGINYKAGVLKLDLFHNKLHFLDAEEKEMIVTSPLKEIVLTDTLTNQSWHFIHSSFFSPSAAIKQGWYLQLATGTVGLYQYFSKTLNENRPYGSATTEQTIITKDEFYIYRNASLQQVKKPKDLLAILSDRQSELEDFVKNNKGGTTAEQFTAIVDFYNQQ